MTRWTYKIRLIRSFRNVYRVTVYRNNRKFWGCDYKSYSSADEAARLVIETASQRKESSHVVPTLAIQNR